MTFIENALVGIFARNKLSILIYHRVLPDGDIGFGDPSISQFSLQMRALRKHFNVLTLREAAEALTKNSLPPRAAVVTFDDGYEDNYSRAIPILQENGLKATFFIATDYLDGGIMWNDRISYSVLNSSYNKIDLKHLDLGVVELGGREQKLEVVKQLLGKTKHLEADQRMAASISIADVAQGAIPDDLMMSSQQVKQMRAAGMEIGGHTKSHPILSRISDATAQEEISGGKAFLENLLQEEITSFAYPNGKPKQDYDNRHALMVKDAGFQCAVSTSWGVSEPGSDIYQLPRFTPWDKTPWKYKLRLYRNLYNTSYQTA